VRLVARRFDEGQTAHHAGGGGNGADAEEAADADQVGEHAADQRSHSAPAARALCSTPASGSSRLV
jgi:hypothetical protein